MAVTVTTLYAALLGMVGYALTMLAGRARGKAGVSLGDGGDKALVEAMRRQANWVENVPFILIMMALIELNGAAHWWLHLLGLVLLASRIVHPIGMSFDQMVLPARMLGMGGTIFVAMATILTGLWQVVTG